VTKKMSAMKIANPYAEAFFQLGLSLYLKEDNPDLFYKLVFDMQDLLKLISEAQDLKDFLENPLNSAKAKKLVLEKCLHQKLSLHTMNFLNLLVDKKRIHLIESIGKTFLEKAYDFVCIKFVEVWSTVELSPKQQKALIHKINSMLGPVFTDPYVQSANIQLSLRIDKKILGGLVIKLGSKVIDLSLRGELKRLGKELDLLL
jgi:F-type H+-transporting ATPase subunit delta